jgi:hypothetical protein
MKQLYLLLFLMGTCALSAQEEPVARADASVEIRLHPNPAEGDLVYVVSTRLGPKTVRIFDLFGKVVLERRLTGDALPIETLIPGVYMVRIEQGEVVVTKKLIVR